MKENKKTGKSIYYFIILTISICSIINYSTQDAFAASEDNLNSAFALQATQTGEESDFIEIRIASNGTFNVSSSTYIKLGLGWVDITAAEVQLFFDTFQFVYYLDGVKLPITGTSYSNSSCGEDCFRMDIDYALGVLSPGTYVASLESTNNGPLFTPECGDGCYGPIQFAVTIIVTAPENTPTPETTATSTATNPPATNPPATNTATSIPPTATNTPTPADIFDLQDNPLITINPPSFISEEYFNMDFREAGPLVPEFTTKIPTPLDVSLEPEVIGTNLFLAAILMIPLAYSNELLGRMLDENEKKRVNKTKHDKESSRWLNKPLAVNAKGRIVFKDRLRILLIILVYGLVFSLLDESWNPFSKEGLLIFLGMAAIFGLVGMLDDFFQWKKIQKWSLPINLKFKTRNFLLAIISIIISRFLFLIPGVMFGTPELLQTDEESISQLRQEQLLKISMKTFTVIGLTVWILTIFTRQLFESSALNAGTGTSILLGIEAMLLIVFAVIVENYFIQMLGFPSSFGQMLKKMNPRLWFFGLMLISFLFVHTLINPRGDLMTAIQKGNVIVFIGVVVTFITGVLITYAFRWIRKRQKN